MLPPCKTICTAGGGGAPGGGIAMPSRADRAPPPAARERRRVAPPTAREIVLPLVSSRTMLSPLRARRFPRISVRSALKNTMIPLLTLSRISLPSIRLSRASQQTPIPLFALWVTRFSRTTLFSEQQISMPAPLSCDQLWATRLPRAVLSPMPPPQPLP